MNGEALADLALTTQHLNRKIGSLMSRGLPMPETREPISKLEAARRQLETAIDLYFDNADSLAVHTLSFAAFKVLFDLYPHRNADGFSARLDEILSKEGWRSMSAPANFLKHADRDPEAVLQSHHPAQAMALIGLATLLYRRIAGDFSKKMKAFDYWFEWLTGDELKIEELDEDEERVAVQRQYREAVAKLPYSEHILVGKRMYRHFLDNFDRLAAEARRGTRDGKTVTQLIDEQMALSDANLPRT